MASKDNDLTRHLDDDTRVKVNVHNTKDTQALQSELRTGSADRAKRASVAGEFIKMDASLSEATEAMTGTRRFKSFAHQLIDNPHVVNFMACVVVADAACTWVDIDSRVSGGSPPPGSVMFADICLVLYTLELLFLFVGRGTIAVLLDWVVILDITVVFCGYVEMIFVQMEAVESANALAKLGIMRALRLARICRLLRLFRKIRGLRELEKLVTMMATCLRTLAWSFLFCFVIMSLWAMLLVEFVDPIMQDMAEEFAGCDFCVASTRSVMEANLLLFKTVIAGDSWGLVAVPIIQKHPGTAVIFVGSLLTLVFGVLNMIIAVVVDTFAEARQNDILNLAEQMEEDIEKDRESLGKLFESINQDGSGELSLEDLIEGARRNPVLQSRLRVMDIDENDLEQLFRMIDADNNGTIEVGEFIGPLSRWVHDSKTAPRFIKYNMLQTMQLQEDLYCMSNHYFKHLSERIDILFAGLNLLGTEGSLASILQSDVSHTLFGRKGSPVPSATDPATGDGPLSSTAADKPAWTGGESPAVPGDEFPDEAAPSSQWRPNLAAGSKHHKVLELDGSESASLAERTRSHKDLDGLDKLLEAVTMKVEMSMLEMESRLKRSLGELMTDPPAVPTTPRAPRAPSAAGEKGRGLFRAVYGEGRSSQNKVTTASIGLLSFAAEGARSRRPAAAYTPRSIDI